MCTQLQARWHLLSKQHLTSLVLTAVAFRAGLPVPLSLLSSPQQAETKIPTFTHLPHDFPTPFTENVLLFDKWSNLKHYRKSLEQLLKTLKLFFWMDSILSSSSRLYSHPFALVFETPWGNSCPVLQNLTFQNPGQHFHGCWAGYRTSGASISSGVRENCTSPRSGWENFKPKVTHPAEHSGPGWELLSRSQATHVSSPGFLTFPHRFFPSLSSFLSLSGSHSSGLGSVRLSAFAFLVSHPPSQQGKPGKGREV